MWAGTCPLLSAFTLFLATAQEFWNAATATSHGLCSSPAPHAGNQRPPAIRRNARINALGYKSTQYLAHSGSAASAPPHHAEELWEMAPKFLLGCSLRCGEQAGQHELLRAPERSIRRWFSEFKLRSPHFLIV